MGNNVTFDEMNELLDEIYRSGGETWVEIDGQVYYTDWGYGAVAIEFFIRMLKNRKSDNDATRERHDGACSDEILSYLDGEWGRDSFEYYVYSDLYEMASEILDENAKLREQIDAAHMSRLLTENENESLRELVQSAVRCITDVPNCDSCALGEQVSGVWVCHLIGAAKELGVEVPS